VESDFARQEMIDHYALPLSHLNDLGTLLTLLGGPMSQPGQTQGSHR